MNPPLLFARPISCFGRRLRCVVTAAVLLAALGGAAQAERHAYLPPDERFADRRVDAAVLADMQRDARFNARLSGPNRIALHVVDARTKRPVPDYVVHALVTRAGADKLDLFADSISHLESKEISDAGGVCVYDKLGSLRVEFQVIAQGYVPNFKMAQIPATKTVTIELQPAGAIAGRIVDAATSRPLADFPLAIAFPFEHEKRHWSWATGDRFFDSYRALTDAAGRFRFEHLPADRYQPCFPDLNDSLRSVTDDLRLKALGDRDSRRHFEQERDATLGGVFPIEPSLPAVVLAEQRTIDIGTIRIEREPVLEIEFYSKGRGPLPLFPFEIVYLSGPTRFTHTWKSTTAAQGRTTVTLVGWKPGMDVLVCSPDYQPQVYRAQAYLDRHPDPLDRFSEKSFYEEEYRNTLGSSGRWPERYENLKDPAQKAKFRKAVEQRRKEIREDAARIAALPDHPACAVVTPQPGQKLSLKIDCKPTTAQLDLHLVFRDKASRAPIGALSGAVSTGNLPDLRPHFLYRGGFEDSPMDDLSGWRLFRASDPTGRVELPALTLLDSVPSGPAGPRPCLLLCAEASGYARQMFELPVAMLRSGKTLAFDLEPEARVRGRVVMDGTGLPPTSATLFALSRRLDPARVGGELHVGVVMANEAIDGGDLSRPGVLPHFNVYAGASVGADGRFEIGGLRPRDGWWLKLSVEDWMPKVALRIDLKPGLNDVGDIRIGRVGALAGRVTDETSGTVAGARFEMPLCGIYRGADLQSDTSGTYRIPLAKVETARQLVRIIPPWGNTDPYRLPCTVTQFDSIRALDPAATNTLNVRLERGHALELTIENPRRLASIGAAWLALGTTATARQAALQPRAPAPYFALCGVQVQALAADADGFTFAQESLFGPRGLSTSTTVIRLENIPAGRHAMVLNGAVYALRSMPVKRSVQEILPSEAVPLAYAEFDMPAADARATLKPALADVRVTMPAPPAAPVQPPLVFVDREQPRSSAFGGVYRRLMVPRQTLVPTDPERQFTPMIGYLTGCFLWDAENLKYVDQPGRLVGVPAGRYRIEAYGDEWDVKAGRPYYQTAIDVPEAGTVEVTCPYQPPRRPDPAPPTFE